jgi:farnesyl-diphosphate farnesyltransferase
VPDWQPRQSAAMSDLQYQNHILQGVSRTFALTIPQLPPPLSEPIGNAYLLCRIADTIEDEPMLSLENKQRFSREYIDVVADKRAAEPFALGLLGVLSPQTSPAEHDLIRNTARVIRMTRRFSPTQQAALSRCVAIMAEGMAYFQARKSRNGLEDMAQLDDYCYYVAGVVGETLTELYCEYSDAINVNRKEMWRLAVSFGQGLQMTNILKDIWEDYRRGVCWLPRDVFDKHGFDLANLAEAGSNHSFHDALGELIAIAHAHLRNALDYTLLIPSNERGIRRFCFLAIGMALLTLRNISRQRSFASGTEVKLSRAGVKTTVVATELVRHGRLLPRALFSLVARGLPSPAQLPITPTRAVSPFAAAVTGPMNSTESNPLERHSQTGNGFAARPEPRIHTDA